MGKNDSLKRDKRASMPTTNPLPKRSKTEKNEKPTDPRKPPTISNEV